MPTAPQTDDTLDPTTTPAGSGDAGTTPPAADNAGTTPPEAAETGTTTEATKAGAQPDIDKIVTARLARERKRWEAESEEKTKRARMDEADRLKAELADKDKEIATAAADLKRERAMRLLAPNVVDAEDAYAIAERLGLVDDDGTVDHAALLAQKPYLAPAPAAQPAKTPATGAGGGALPKDPAKLSDAEFYALRTKA